MFRLFSYTIKHKTRKCLKKNSKKKNVFLNSHQSSASYTCQAYLINSSIITLNSVGDQLPLKVRNLTYSKISNVINDIYMIEILDVLIKI